MSLAKRTEAELKSKTASLSGDIYIGMGESVFRSSGKNIRYTRSRLSDFLTSLAQRFGKSRDFLSNSY